MVISIQGVFYLFSELQSFSIGSSRSSFSKREHVPRPSAPGAREPVVFLKKASRGSYTEASVTQKIGILRLELR